MPSLSPNLYSLLTPEELEREVLTKNDEFALLVHNTMHDTIMDMVDNQQDHDDSISNMQSEITDLEESLEEQEAIRNTIVDAVTEIAKDSIWVYDEESDSYHHGINDGGRFKMHCEAELALDESNGYYTLLISPYHGGTEPTIMASNLEEAKAKATNILIAHVLEHDVTFYRSSKP